MNEKTIAVDFDGTMNKYLEWGDGSIKNEPLDGCIQGLKNLRDSGYKLVIFTTRTNVEVNGLQKALEQQAMIRKWLVENDLDFIEIAVAGKPLAEIYIDDRGIKFENNWSEIVQFISEKK